MSLRHILSSIPGVGMSEFRHGKTPTNPDPRRCSRIDSRRSTTVVRALVAGPGGECSGWPFTQGQIGDVVDFTAQLTGRRVERPGTS